MLQPSAHRLVVCLTNTTCRPALNHRNHKHRPYKTTHYEAIALIISRVLDYSFIWDQIWTSAGPNHSKVQTRKTSPSATCHELRLLTPLTLSHKSQLSTLSLSLFGNRKSAIGKSWRMPGVTGPSDYSREPRRHPSLKINAKAVFFLILLLQFNLYVKKLLLKFQSINEPFNHRSLSMRSHRVQLWVPLTSLPFICSTREITVLFQSSTISTGLYLIPKLLTKPFIFSSTNSLCKL